MASDTSQGTAPKADARDTLGVPAGATQAEIRAAWQRYAARHHPDKGGDAEIFKEGRAAFDLLTG